MDVLLSSKEWSITPDTHEFVRLWRAYWQVAEKEEELAAQKIITLNSLLPMPEDKLYIRNCYTEWYDAIAENCADPLLRRVQITGQSGTGKTYFLLYVLAKKLAKGETVLFRRHEDCWFYFSASGVQWTDHNVPATIILDIHPLTWALVDSCELPSSLASPRPIRVAFIVQTVSPMSRPDAESLYLRQQYRGDVWHWCVPRWDLAEIMVCITHSNLIVKLLGQHSNDSPPFPLDDAISAARQKWGDAPRDIIYALFDEDWLERNLRSALSRPNMNDFFRDICKSELFNINICPTATVVSTYRKDTILKKNAVTVEFTSPYVASRVQRALDTSWGVTRPEGSAFVTFAQERGEGVNFVGWAFERYCIDQLSNAGPSPFTVCGETTQVTSETGTIYTCALQTPPTPSSLLSKLRSKLLGSSKLDPPSPTSLLPITFGYHVLDDSKLYLPEKSNFPLLDAFYVRLSGKRCTVVVLQFTNSTCHKGSPKGYDFLVSLKESFRLQLRNRFPSDVPMDKKRRRIREIGFEYRLVVPLSSTSDSDAPTRSISWHMPADMPEAIKGPVFVQFLPVELPVIDRVEDESSFVINKQIEA